MTEFPNGTGTRRPWIAPALLELPRLSDLTLATGSGVVGTPALFVGGWIKAGS
jgi:hypothetical protein